MDKVVKIFCAGPDQDRLSGTYQAIERYQGFLLASIPEEQLGELAARYPVEDITDLYTLELEGQIIDTSQPRVDAHGKELAHPHYKGSKKLVEGPHHYVVQFIGPIKEDWLAAVVKAGGRLRSPLDAFCYVVRLNGKSLAAVAALPCVRWIGHLPHSARVHPSVLAHAGRKAGDVGGDLPRTRVLPSAYAVEFFDADDMAAAVPAIEALGLEILEQDAGAGLLILRDPKSGAGTAKRIRDLSAVHGVRYVRERSLKRTSNDVATRIMGSGAVTGQPGLELAGEGEIIGVCDTGIDTGDPAAIHADFTGRIVSVKSYPITADFSQYITNPGGDDGPADLDSGHGTHVSGSVFGSGAASVGLSGVNGAIAGLASKAKLVFQAVEQEMKWKNPKDFQNYGRYLLAGLPLNLTTLFADAYAKKARIHSNSWGGGDPGAYDAQCEQLDRFVWDNKDFCVLFAAGNDGTDKDGDGKINPMSVTSPGTAKNCITVGASENQRPAFNGNVYGDWWPEDYPAAPYRSDSIADNPDQMAAFSSRGPTADGRVKPDVVAPGTFILSTRSTLIAANNTAWSPFPQSKLYFYMGGTSMATPLCAGAVALIREYLRKQKSIVNPSAALLKAALIAGTHRLPGYGEPGAVFDNEQGYGRVNLDAILAPPAPAQAEFLEIRPGLRTGEVFSKPVEIGSADAPLRVVLAYTDYPGPMLVNNLNLVAIAPDGKRYVGNQAAGALLSLDTKNNVEVVHVANPTPGLWRLEVTGSNISQGPQDFALVTLAPIGEIPDGTLIRLDAMPALNIPDNSAQGVSSELAVTRTGTVSSVKVGVEIIHPYIGDLKVTLTAPNGTGIVLHERSGASADNLVKTYDAQSTPGLGALTGSAVQGSWTLSVADLAKKDVGQFNRWSLEIGLGPSNTLRKEQTPSLSIPDNDPNGVTDTLDVTETGTVKNLKVWLDITHTYIGDLRVRLLAPSGKTVTLHERTGGSQDNLIKTYDTSVLPALQSLTGEAVQGAWRLQAFDLAGRDMGKLNRWGIEVVL